MSRTVCNLTRNELAPFEPLFQEITDKMFDAIKRRPRKISELDILTNSYEEGEKLFLKLLFIQGRNNVSEVTRRQFHQRVYGQLLHTQIDPESTKSCLS